MNFNNEKPIYIQLAEWMEDAILSGAFAEDAQVPSTTEISINYKINPATALKGINILVDSEIIYKKRGLGMFVSIGAKEKILEKRKVDFFDNFIASLVSEADKLGLEKNEVVSMIERRYEK
ncbi:MAG: GntR family transcriptional regulator [Eubacteriales bacterium]